MKENRVKMLVENFKVINGVVYLRLENGNITVEDDKSVVICTNPSDNVELVSLQKGELSVNFWQVNDRRINALAANSSFVLPKGAIISDFYGAKELEGAYVKYVMENSCGMLFVSETEISKIFEDESSYKDISLADGVFYAESKDNRFDILGQDGKVMFSFPFKCKKVEGYNLFYTDHYIFSKIEEKMKVEGKIQHIKIISEGEIQVIRVVTDKGIFYYDTFKRLLGPIKKDRIVKCSYKDLYIFEEDGEKIVSLFYISKKKTGYQCKKISSKLGIEVVGNLKDWSPCNLDVLLVANQPNGLKNVYAPNLRCLVSNVETYKKSKGYYERIVGFIKDLPAKIYMEEYGRANKSLKIIGKGISAEDKIETYICKSNKNELFCIRKDGELIFNVTGGSCCIKKWKEEEKTQEVYFIETGDLILVLDSNGDRPWF